MFMLIAIVFIAELIIAFQIISLIMKADRKVCDINACVKEFNPLEKTCMQYARCLSASFSEKIKKGIEVIQKQRLILISKTIIVVAIYTGLILFRIRRIKFNRLSNLIGAISDIALDLAV